MDFDELLALRPALERRLRADFATERRRVPPVFREHVASLEEFTLRGGKRFRALLLLGGYWIASGKDPTPALPAAAALEHFQSWMLIHDDIIDHAETRRSGPTIHRIYEGRHRERSKLGPAPEYGVGMGITAGDLEEPFTVSGLLDAPGTDARRLAALREYARMTRETAYGQLLDIENGARPVDAVRESDVLQVHRLKSAIYTVASPLRIGAMLGGSGPALLDDLEAIGIDFGIAFQLRDDVLGAGFDSEKMGKSANDLQEGKRTLLVVRAWATADAEGRSRLTAVLGRADADPASVDAAREVIRSTGSLEYSERKIAQLSRRARQRIARSRGLRADARALLNEVGDRLLYRSV